MSPRNRIGLVGFLFSGLAVAIVFWSITDRRHKVQNKKIENTREHVEEVQAEVDEVQAVVSDEGLLK
jgi:hypothetical protein